MSDLDPFRPRTLVTNDEEIFESQVSTKQLTERFLLFMKPTCIGGILLLVVIVFAGCARREVEAQLTSERDTAKAHSSDLRKELEAARKEFAAAGRASAAVDEMVAKAAAHFRTDFSGKAILEGIEPGEYYIVGIASFGLTGVLWNRQNIPEGKSRVLLSADNAEFAR
jgi:outer membrane murein-binding lipoprotein Lpp